MKTRNVTLPSGLDKFVSKEVEDGTYSNASEVVQAGLHALQQIQGQAELRRLIQEGLDSGEPQELDWGEFLESLSHAYAVKKS